MTDQRDTLDKQKRGAVPDPDDVVDLDALAREYEEKYANLRGEMRLEDDKPKRKNDRLAIEDEAPASRKSEDAANTWREAKGEVREDLKKAGVELREAWGEIKREFQQAKKEGRLKPGQMGALIDGVGKNFGDKFGKNLSQFFSTPYEQGDELESAEPTTSDERTWAALSHTSSVLTLLAGVGSGGMMVPLTIFIPLLIYMHWRNKSRFVARHAMQAFSAQLVGTLGFLAIVLGSVLGGVVLTVILAITLVGILAIPFLWLAIVLVLLASIVLPVGMAGFGIVGAVAASQGKNYKYPYVGKLGRKIQKRMPNAQAY